MIINNNIIIRSFGCSEIISELQMRDMVHERPSELVYNSHSYKKQA